MSFGQFIKWHSFFDDTANDNDKTLTVPDGQVWELLYAHMLYTSDATVGNRTFEVNINDANGNTIIDLNPAVTQAASLTIHYEMLQGIYRESAVILNAIQTPLPKDMFLLPGWTIRFYDFLNVSATDDMTISGLFRVWKA